MSVIPFTVSQFYGQRRKRDIETVSNGKLSTPFPHRILGPTVCWKLFYRQAEAFKCAAQVTQEDVTVFAFESENGNQTGKRKYLVTSLPVFWHYYSQLEPSQRHHYEIIPEGSPCKLFFDLEFKQEFNSDHDGDQMVNILIKYVCLWLETSFNIACDRSCVLDLEASIQGKFSRHLIFHLEGALFDNCKAAGNFVHHIFRLLVEYIELQTRESSTVVQSGHRQCQAQAHDCQLVSSTSYCHSGPVAFTQASRDLIEITAGDLNLTTSILQDCHNGECLSNKRHPSSSSSLKHLCFGFAEDQSSTGIRSAAEWPNSYIAESGQEKLFMSTCSKDLETEKIEKGNREETRDYTMNDHWLMIKVCSQFSLSDLQSLLVTNKDGNQTLFCDLGVYTKNRNFRLYLSSKLKKNNPLLVSRQNQFIPSSQTSTDCSKDKEIFYASLVSNVRQHQTITRRLCFELTKILHRMKKPILSKSPRMCQEGRNDCKDHLEGNNCSSPYPELDHFIQCLISTETCNGRIRHWTYFMNKQIIVYDIIGYRWCGNIEREHRSNNIIFVVDVARGLYYQKCHDPDCQAVGYKSEAKSVPYQLLPASFFDVDQLSSQEELDDLGNSDTDADLLAVLDQLDQPSISQGAVENKPNVSDDDEEAMMAATEKVEVCIFAPTFVNAPC